MNNLHISLNRFTHASRVLKETKTLSDSGEVKNIFIVALHEPDLPEFEVIDNVRSLYRVKLRTRGFSKSLFFQLIKYLEFGLRVFLYTRDKNIKIINVHSLGVLPVGVFLKTILRAKLVYDAHELETETEDLRGVRKNLSKITEKLFIRSVDLTIVVGEGIEHWYKSTYEGLPIVTVFNCPAYKHQVRSQKLRTELDIPEKYKIVLYQGGLFPRRGVVFLLETFKSLKASDYAMVFMGYGAVEDEIKEAAEKFPHIFFMPAVLPHEVLDYTVSADIGIHPMGGDSLNHKLALPNKLFEYIMARLPVIVSDLPEMGNVVNKYLIGQLLTDWSTEALLSALQKIESMPPKELYENLEIAAHQFNWEVQEKKMINAYEKYVFGS